MKGKLKVRLAVFSIILAACCWLPSPGLVQAKEVDWQSLKGQVKKMYDLKALKLSPEKEQALL